MPKSLTAVQLPTGGYATERWRRAILPDPTVSETAYAGSAPTITNAQTSTPTSGYIKYSPEGVTLAGTDVTQQYSYQGAGGFAIGTGSEITYVSASSRYPNAWGSQNIFAVEFGTDAATFQMRFRYMHANSRYKLFIDGKPVTDVPAVFTGFGTAGNSHLQTVALGSAKARRIRYEFYFVPFGGIFAPPAATVWYVPPKAGRFMVLGDSITDGSDENNGAGAGTWAYRAGRMLGHTDIWEQGKGGTGYTVAGSSATFGNRVAADVVAWNPDRLIIWGGVNDVGVTVATVGAAAASVFSAVAAIPQCQTFVIGVYDQLGTAVSSRTNLDAELRTRAATAGLPFISPITGACYDAKGTLVCTQGPWIKPGQITAYVGADTVHPTDAGHAYLARRVFDACSALMPN